MDAMKRKVMAVPREKLFPEGAFSGFAPAGGVDYGRRILSGYQYLERSRAEEDPRFKQPIGYALLYNPGRGLVFAYRRSSRDREYPEKRLQGKWSWGLGGHIEEDDAAVADPVRQSLLREIAEETGVSELGRPEIMGYINDDSDPVGSVHFGVLCLVETRVEKVSPLSPELASGRMLTLPELRKLCVSPGIDVEDWSRIALDALEDRIEPSRPWIKTPAPSRRG